MKLTISNETKPNSECFDWWFMARSPKKQYTHMGKMRHIHWKSNPLAKYCELIFDEWDNNFRWFSFTSRAEYIIKNGWHCNHVNHVKSNIRWIKQWLSFPYNQQIDCLLLRYAGIWAKDVFFGCILHHQMTDDFIIDELTTIIPDLIKQNQTEPYPTKLNQTRPN